jgi:hypothetical protein
VFPFLFVTTASRALTELNAMIESSARSPQSAPPKRIGPVSS